MGKNVRALGKAALQALRHRYAQADAHLAKLPTAAYVLAVFLLSFTFMFATNGDLLSQTLSTAFLPNEAAAPQEDTLQVDTTAADSAALAVEEYVSDPRKLARMEPLPPQQVDSETLWLARCIYSETKRPHEQELVAWVVRNRVETGYRGKNTYQEVVLDPYQFSAFNPGTRTRRFYTGLTPASRSEGWQNALAIAKQVKEAPAEVRPFTETTRHFFSEQSMAGGRHPNWSRGKRPVRPEREFTLESRRFRFYANVY